MNLGVHRLPATIESMDQIHLPQRASAVQRAGVQAGSLRGQLLVVAGRGQRQFADMELDVEVRVLDPVGLIQSERHLG